MNNFARINDGVVVEIIAAETISDLKRRYHPEIVAACRPCGMDVREGWVLAGNTLHAPADIKPSLEEVKDARIAVLRAVCEAAITGGFKSAALGSVHTYPSDLKAQINLMGSVTDSLMPDLPANWQTPFWVCDPVGVWAYKMHSAAQIQQAGRDGKINVITCQAALDNLVVTVLAADTAEAVASVVWPEDAPV